MKVRLISLFAALLLVSFFIFLNCSESRAEGLKGKWGLGLRLGPSFLAEENSDSTRGDPGPMINGTLFYGLTERVVAGVDLEWERHAVIDNLSGFNYGDASTVSIMPRVEYHFQGGRAFSPYLLFGAGINLNSFNPGSDLQASCAGCKLEPENILALKGGAGFDYRITPNLAFNTEIALKMNDGSANISGTFGSFTSGSTTDFRLCSVSYLFGIRYFY
ncbi:MAG TPA: outer membrane beta-barrel protein [Nitrospiria bacterium]|nr:outer membrane beta-barrel protein [Nitrospiria bacterium]